jgi:hypothetical protein
MGRNSWQEEDDRKMKDLGRKQDVGNKREEVWTCTECC